jgi:hypothetical protein
VTLSEQCCRCPQDGRARSAFLPLPSSEGGHRNSQSSFLLTNGK